MKVKAECPICGAEALELPRTGDSRIIECPGCGEFRISGSAEQLLRNAPLDAEQRANASGWLREHRETPITVEVLQRLQNLASPMPLAKSLKLLAYLAEATSTPGQVVRVRVGDRAAMASGWLRGEVSELAWHIEQALGSQGWITFTPLADGSGFDCVVTPQGLQALRDSKRKPLGFRDGQR